MRPSPFGRPYSVEVLAALVKKDVKISDIDARRKKLMKKSLELTQYKGQLLQRVELAANSQVAAITIPWEEIQKYSPLFNPPMLVMEDMRMIEGVKVAIAFKHYNDGKITGKIRCNPGSSIAKNIAEAFGGGGHDYAAGFKVTDGRSLDEVKSKVYQIAEESL